MRIHLDDVVALQRLDSAAALAETAAYDAQFRAGLELAKSIPVPSLARPVQQIVVLGTGGGSAASVNLLKSFLFDQLPVPLTLSQGYTLPAYVNEHTLVIVVTHSGNTEEVVQSYEAAITAGSQAVVLTAGGRAEELARAHGHPLVKVPGGMMPRIALGYLFVPILMLLSKLGLVPDKTAEVEETIELFSRLRDDFRAETELARNPAKQLALEMDGLTPVVYGTVPFTDAVAWRFKNQLGENSKVMAFWNAIPNLHHDEAVGWDGPSAMLRGFHFTLLADAEDGEKNARRLEITAEILRERAGGVRILRSTGSSRLARLFSLVYLTDFVTLYLALVRGVDPTPVHVIDLFKRKMAELPAESRGRG